MTHPAYHENLEVIRSCDIGEKPFIKLSRLLQFNQVIGDDIISQNGGSYDQLYKDGIVFVITNTCVEFKRIPKVGETIKLASWQSGNKRMYFYRDTEIFDSTGEKIAGISITCVTVDPYTHRILRPNIYLSYNPPMLSDKLSNNRQHQKIKFPEDMTLVGKRKVRYSDLDVNGHVNNTVYADIAVDFMQKNMNEYAIKFFDISYISESRPEDEIDIYYAEEGNNIYLKGEHERGKSFEIYAELERITE